MNNTNLMLLLREIIKKMEASYPVKNIQSYKMEESRYISYGIFLAMWFFMIAIAFAFAFFH